MRKAFIGAMIATAVAAAPALASGAGAQSVRVGDRVGAVQGPHKNYLPKVAIAAIGFTALALTVWVWDQDRDDNDPPVSL